MFGEMRLPKFKPRTRPKPLLTAINMPDLEPYSWAHMGRPADTDYAVKLLQYKQRKDADYNRRIELEKEKLSADKFGMKFDRHATKRRFQCELEKRLNIRLQEYDETIDKRREKLKELLGTEEREFYRETVQELQDVQKSKMEDVKKIINELTSKRENEREEIVKQKRLQQYIQRNVDVRNVISKKNLIESKNCQLQQMRENEARRQVEKEYDRMWADIANKEVQAKREREEYEAINKYQKDKEMKDVWDMQIQGKELLQSEIERVALEDKIELEKLSQQLKKEEMEELIEKRRKRDQIDAELQQQIKIREKVLEERRMQEETLNNAFSLLSQLEIDKENMKKANTAAIAKREMAMYRANLAELEAQRKKEDKRLNELLESYTIDIQKNQDEAKCKIEAARKKLQEDSIKGLAEQIAYKRKIAEEELKMQQDENELVTYAYEANRRLAVETARQEAIAKQQYSNDLLKQIEYNKRIQEKQKQEIERQLAAGKQEEERYQKMIATLPSANNDIGAMHPFQKVLQRYDCLCSTALKPFQ